MNTSTIAPWAKSPPREGECRNEIVTTSETVCIGEDDFFIQTIGPPHTVKGGVECLVFCIHGLGLSAHSWLPFARTTRTTSPTS